MHDRKHCTEQSQNSFLFEVSQKKNYNFNEYLFPSLVPFRSIIANVILLLLVR